MFLITKSECSELILVGIFTAPIDQVLLDRLGSDLLQFFNPRLFVVQANLMANESMIDNLPFGAVMGRFLENFIDRI